MSDNDIKDALLIIEKYGQIDGSHHKQWCLDQVARCLLRHFGVRYEDWVINMKEGADGPDTYSYDEGIAP
jgi:hypothetical protein